MFQPNLSPSGVQIVVIKDSAVHYNVVFFPPLLIASGYFGVLGYHLKMAS
jgi:hypothetical protein